MRVGMAVLTGHHDKKHQLAANLTVASYMAEQLGAYVNGTDFALALRGIAAQLLENIERETADAKLS